MAHKETEESTRPLAPIENRQERITCSTAIEAASMAHSDFSAFADLYQLYRIPIYRYFYQHVGNIPDAEDLTAITFTKALSSLDRYQEQGHFSAWLFGIARHTLYDAQRRRYTHISIDEVEPLLTDVAQDPEAQVLQAELTHVLHHVLRQLPADQQVAVTLRFFSDLSHNEIASKLGRSVAAVKMLVHRAMTTFRAQYHQAELLETMPQQGRSSVTASVRSLMEWVCGSRAWQPVVQPIVCRVTPPQELVIYRRVGTDPFL